MNIENEYKKCNIEKKIILNDLKNIIDNSDEGLEGNLFFSSDAAVKDHLYIKQLNLFYLSNQKIKKICEIGFNAGHSTFLMLLNKQEIPLEFTIFDINIHKYTKPCFEYIKTKFQNIKFEFIEGDSIITMPKWINENKNLLETYDLIHVDGGHSEECIINDMKNANLLLKINGIMIIDDTNLFHINKHVNLYLSSGKYIEIYSKTYHHRILRKIKYQYIKIYNISNQPNFGFFCR